MACWDCLGSAGIDPTMPGLARSLPRGVDRAPGPLFLLPGPCRPRRTLARPGLIPRCQGWPDPSSVVSTAPRGTYASYQALAGSGAPVRGPLQGLSSTSNSHRLATGYGETVRF